MNNTMSTQKQILTKNQQNKGIQSNPMSGPHAFPPQNKQVLTILLYFPSRKKEQLVFTMRNKYTSSYTHVHHKLHVDVCVYVCICHMHAYIYIYICIYVFFLIAYMKMFKSVCLKTKPTKKKKNPNPKIILFKVVYDNFGQKKHTHICGALSWTYVCTSLKFSWP